MKQLCSDSKHTQIILLNPSPLLFPQMNPLNLILLHVTLITSAWARCAFQVGADGVPKKVDTEPFLITGMTKCVEYNGQMGCCDSGNDAQQANSYTQIDGIFGSLGAGCDICAINLKRFWCEYACSPNQSNFLDVQEGLWPVPNPQKPDETLMVQKLEVTVHAQTACDLFNSCSRIPFASSVSAMGTPAGFLTFQGHNAANDALQDMTIKFSYNQSESLFFSDERTEESGKALIGCNHTAPEGTIHGFSFDKNCTCNNCESSCKDDKGFHYEESGVMEGFNYWLVGSVWLFSIVVALCLSKHRRT